MVPSLEGVELMAVLLGDAKRLAAHAVPSGCAPARPVCAGVPTSGASTPCDGDATCAHHLRSFKLRVRSLILPTESAGKITCAACSAVIFASAKW